jgi:hypothetical protein
MLQVQKQSLIGDILTFNVILEDGRVQPCVYKLVDETEDELMARVALHIESEVAAREANIVIDEAVAEPVKEVSVSKTGKVSVKAIPVEPVA